MKRTIQILLLLACAIPSVWCRAAEAEHSGYVAIGQPTIFWRNGEWQTYKDGRWVPYFESLRQDEAAKEAAAREAATMPEPEPVLVPEQPPIDQPPDMGVSVYGGGYGYFFWDPFFQRRHFGHGRDRDHRRNVHDKSASAQAATPAAGIGQTTIGIGQQNGGIGRPTIGIGPQRPSIGQPTAAIGKPTIGIGQPAGAIGRPLFSPAPAPAPVTHSQASTERSGSGNSGRR